MWYVHGTYVLGDCFKDSPVSRDQLLLLAVYFYANNSWEKLEELLRKCSEN